MNQRVVNFNFIPHYHSVTRTGSSNFQRIADATAEFIDNSIQACKDNSIDEDRKIDVGIYLKTLSVSSNGGYAVIIDNGEGMSEENLKNFAIYSLDQDTRNRPCEGQEDFARTSFISKFGVGAKQAGFFLGMKI